MDDISTSAAASQLREHDTPAMRTAFAGIPRLALLAILDMGGVSRRPVDNLGLEAAGYYNGMRALALEILARAGFDHVSILAGVISGHLEGDNHDRYDSGPARSILDGDAADQYEPNAEY